jgi:hypothetical protein
MSRAVQHGSSPTRQSRLLNAVVTRSDMIALLWYGLDVSMPCYLLAVDETCHSRPLVNPTLGSLRLDPMTLKRKAPPKKSI